MKTHELKTWRGPFQALWDGTKRFEFRKDDRGFCVGDLLMLREWDPSGYIKQGSLGHTTVRGAFTGRTVDARVSYILRGGFGMPDGYVVMSLDAMVNSDEEST